MNMNLTRNGQLVHKSTNKRHHINDVLTFGGDKKEYIITGWRAPHKPSSCGELYIVAADDEDQPNIIQLYPQVLGLKIINYYKNWQQ